MRKDLFEFACPCCRKRIELDVRTGEARAVKPSDALGGKDLDALIGEHKHESERLDHVFGDAARKHKRQQERLADLFEKAKEEVDEAGEAGKKPTNPFDLD